MNKLITTFFIWLTVSNALLYAQIKKAGIPYTESIVAHINNDFFVTGETLYYSIYCQNADKQPSSFSKLAYIELIGENERPLLQSKIELTDGIGASDFFLPSTLPSGNYTLIAYTKWMRNFSSQNFFKKQITIVNPYLKPVSSEVAASTNKNLASPYPSSPGIKNEISLVKINSDNKRYYQRQKVRVVIKNTDSIHACRILLNVHYNNKNSNSISSSSKTDSINKNTTSSEPLTNGKFATFLPDLKGETIGGIVQEIGSKKQVANTAIYLSASPNTFQMSRTDSTGRFYFSTKNIQTQNGIKFQIDQPSGSAPVEVILDEEFISDYEKFKPSPFSIDTTLRKQIEQRNIYNQIENAYFFKKSDSTTDSNKEAFFGKPDKVYKLDDYTRFPTMEDIFREYMYEVVVLKREGKFMLRLINTNSKNGSRFSNSPLLLLDGLRVSDTEILMNYNPLLIKSISLITRSYVYGGLLFDGILFINTYKADAEDLPITSIQKNYTSWQKSKKYYSPDYGKNESLKRIPDFRFQLLWNPTINIEPGEQFIQEFYTSDIYGDFVVEVMGFNSNGEVITLQDNIEVLK